MAQADPARNDCATEPSCDGAVHGLGGARARSQGLGLDNHQLRVELEAAGDLFERIDQYAPALAIVEVPLTDFDEFPVIRELRRSRGFLPGPRARPVLTRVGSIWHRGMAT
ncbi:hypothetical protein [Amycolatopsis sp. SID8362]|uniref:hypothetical protein n=1 Tax=Amycolatopsis sp. SID8362 TaxID=2690346 RepID=UPI00136ABA2E|nr:hypothetical protein [Amycolatopsis sp. SID8362]NBH03526.1 hypothetical protein [Amycolatopsis sp. SID8362]NBH04631.1 hypothetical protein [Amycolatopsis sp. SID8362]NED40227.1 hypothetical protein [Amycolatopsis sp. SID8362]NED41331.1 hypothetical protein [Amycolatopsis sp. SID8362]